MKAVIAILAVISLSACGNPIQVLEKQIRKNGYILYRTPLEEAGTGTIVGGGPRNLSIVAHPSTCFPNQENIPLRRVENSALGSLTEKVEFDFNVKLTLLEFLGNANSLFKVNVGFDMVDTVELHIKGAKVEYLDSVILRQIYANMNPICTDYLDQVAFIIQALRVDEMTFAFKRNNGAYIELDMDAIEEILDIAVGVHYRVDQNYLLTFETPKYIGYQLGRMQKRDDGMVLYRATKTLENKFLFKSIALFPQSANQTLLGQVFGVLSTEALKAPQIPDEQLLDPYSIFLD